MKTSEKLAAMKAVFDLRDLGHSYTTRNANDGSDYGVLKGFLGRGRFPGEKADALFEELKKSTSIVVSGASWHEGENFRYFPRREYVWHEGTRAFICIGAWESEEAYHKGRAARCSEPKYQEHRKAEAKRLYQPRIVGFEVNRDGSLGAATPDEYVEVDESWVPRA